LILADTSIWIDHFRSRNALFFDLLQASEILVHPFVRGELMLGGTRGAILDDIRMLPPAPVATAAEVERLIEGASLAGRGIGYVDAALLASARLGERARLWTLDRRLAGIAGELSIAFDPAE